MVTDEFAWLTKFGDLTDNAGSLKHMTAGERRLRLARKYTEPVSLLIDTAVIVRPTVRMSAVKRLLTVRADLAEIVGNGA